MAILRKIAQVGHHVLREEARKVLDPKHPGIRSLIEDMVATCEDADGVGIAAPQVYESLRVIVVASKPSPRYPHAPLMTPLAMINPMIESRDGSEEEGWEGCLSMPGLRARVIRRTKITVSYMDLHGKRHLDEYSDFVARVIQHEIDHLNGIMFFDKADPRGFVSEVEFQRRVREGRL